MLGLNDALSCLSRNIYSKVVMSSGNSVVGTAAVLIGEHRARARVIDFGLVVAELFASSARALLVRLASGIGEVDEVPARNADDNWAEHVV